MKRHALLPLLVCLLLNTAAAETAVSLKTSHQNSFLPDSATFSITAPSQNAASSASAQDLKTPLPTSAAVSITASSQNTASSASAQDLKTLELQFQEKMLDLREKNDKQADELREKTLNAWQDSISMWLAIMPILSFIIPWVMSRNIKRRIRQKWEDTHAQLKAEADETRIEFNSILEEVKQIRADIQQVYQTASENANEIENHLQKIKNFNQEKSDSQEQKDAVQAAESLKGNREIPLAEQLCAHAIVLSAHAKSYAEHEQAFYAWQVVLQLRPNNAQAIFNAAYEARQAYKQGNRLQQSVWFAHIEQGYQQGLELSPNNYWAINNWGITLNDEAQALAQNNRFNEAWGKWNKAYKLFGNALHIKKDFHQAVYNWMFSIMNESHSLKQNQQDQTAQAKLAEAQNLAEDFIQNYPQHAAELAYNLACVYALSGSSADKVVEQLKLAATSSKPPSKTDIEQDKDFDSIRYSPAFQNWFKQTFPE